LGTTLLRVVEYLRARGGTWEVLVVDDGSRDRTFEVAAGFSEQGVQPLRLPANRGKGAALRRGVLNSRGRRVLLMDADQSTPIRDLELLEPHLETAAVVLGSRAVAASRVERRQPFYREWMGKIFNRLVRWVAVDEVRDTQCGFKLLDGDAARRLFADMTVDRFAYDVELVWLARRRGLGVAEVGVSWSNHPDSRVDPLKDSLRMLWDVLTLRWRHRREGK
jgi:dolichyl-phosphate beta-glucosyltransferase